MDMLEKMDLLFGLLNSSSLSILSRFGVSLSSDNSPKSTVRNGGGGRGSASEDEDVEEEASPQQSTAAQTQSECLNIPSTQSLSAEFIQ